LGNKEMGQLLLLLLALGVHAADDGSGQYDVEDGSDSPAFSR